MSEENKVYVNESKFNGVSTLTVYGTEEKDMVKRVARQFFRDEYGHSPSKVVAEKKYHSLNNNEWEVMVADHSSGSLKKGREYEV